MIGYIKISEKLYLPIIYIVSALIIYFILIKVVDKVLVINKINKNKTSIQKKREETIVNLIKSIIKYIIAVFTILAILGIYGFETKTLIASLGVAGAIIGLAFQDAIKNLLSGIIIIFDNHYMQGDIVTINDFKGEVIDLGLQTTKVKAYSGEVMIIDNSLITSVINHSMYDTKLIIDIPVIKSVTLETLEEILNNINDKIKLLDEVKGDIVLLGIDKLNANNYVYKIEINCVSNNQYSVNRKFMKLLKEEYENNGIDVPADYLIVKEDVKKLSK